MTVEVEVDSSESFCLRRTDDVWGTGTSYVDVPAHFDRTRTSSVSFLPKNNFS